jgi:hypothetical protein
MNLGSVRATFLHVVVDWNGTLLDDLDLAVECVNEPCRLYRVPPIDEGDQPLDNWLRDPTDGRSRLPDLTAPVMKAVVLSWFHPDLDTFSYVCNHCGPQYPRLRAPPPNTWKVLPGKVPNVDPPPWYDLPELFKACPHCAASTRDATYSHLTGDIDLPWKALDGWMGQGRR